MTTLEETGDTQLRQPHLRISPDALVQALPTGELVIMHLRTEEYFGLDEVGGRFWAVLTESGSVDAAHARLTEEFDVEPNELRVDLQELLHELHGCGLLIFDEE